MRYVVVCSEYRCGPFSTREVAERRLAGIETGGHCLAQHTIEDANS